MTLRPKDLFPCPTTDCKKCGAKVSDAKGFEENSLLLCIFGNSATASGSFVTLTSEQVYICASCRPVVEDSLMELGFFLAPSVKPKKVDPNKQYVDSPTEVGRR